MAPNVTCALVLFLSLKEKKSPRLDLHFYFLCFPVPRAGRMETVQHFAPGGYPTPELVMRKWDVAPVCLLSQWSLTGQGRHPQSILSLPSSLAPAQEPFAAPKAGRSKLGRLKGPAPNSLQRPLSPPHVCLQSGPIIPAPLSM